VMALSDHDHDEFITISVEEPLDDVFGFSQ
jgi:hypothetical protein